MHYALACDVLADFAARHGVPVAETQAGKGAVAWGHPSAMGAIGVAGGTAANALAAEADLILAIGTRLSDFTTASRSLFRNPSATLIQLNTAGFDAEKHGALPLVADARAGLDALDRTLATWAAPAGWTTKGARLGRRMERDGDAGNGIIERRLAERCTGARRGKPGDWPTRCDRMRRRRIAGGIAQIVALPRGRHLSRRIRLFLHGVRDRRRAWSQARHARPRGLGGGR